MTTFLLDVNVLIVLVDPARVQHDQAHDGLSRPGRKSFASCSLIENALFPTRSARALICPD